MDNPTGYSSLLVKVSTRRRPLLYANIGTSTVLGWSLVAELKPDNLKLLFDRFYLSKLGRLGNKLLTRYVYL